MAKFIRKLFRFYIDIILLNSNIRCEEPCDVLSVSLNDKSEMKHIDLFITIIWILKAQVKRLVIFVILFTANDL